MPAFLKDADQGPKLPKLKLLDLDADDPRASVHAPVGVACVSEDADLDLKMSRAPDLFPGAWLRAESNPKLHALIAELDHKHRSYLAFVNGDRQRLWRVAISFFFFFRNLLVSWFFFFFEAMDSSQTAFLFLNPPIG